MFVKTFQTSRTLKYHVVEHYLTEESILNGEEFSSWLGMDFLVKITKPGAGMVCKNIVVTTTHSEFVSIKFIFTK